MGPGHRAAGEVPRVLRRQEPPHGLPDRRRAGDDLHQVGHAHHLLHLHDLLHLGRSMPLMQKEKMI